MRVLVTGAAGEVGNALRPWLAERYAQVVLSDLRPIDDLMPNESFVQLDVADALATRRHIQNVDGVIHLAGLVGPDFSFQDVIGPNVIGTYHVLEASRVNSIDRVVLASSHHTVGLYARTDLIDHTALPRPDSFYGVSKAFGESLARYYVDKHGLSVLVIRIGFVGQHPIDERRLHTWISPRDLAQLVDIGLSRQGLRYELVYGVSRNPDPFFDNRRAEQLGYTPQDNALDHLLDEQLLAQRPDPTQPEQRFIGGHFVTRQQEMQGD